MRVPAGDGERLRFGDVEVVVRIATQAFTLIEEHAPPDTPLHIHSREDELFYGLDGEHVIQLGNEEHLLGPGDAVFAPRGIPHAQRRVVPRTGSLLIMIAPGGFEGFFRELAAADPLDAAAYAHASERYGITWLG